MKALSLQTRLFIAAAFLGLFAAGAAGAFWIRSEADADLALSFQRDLAVLSRLPRLQGALRELDLLTDLFLLTGSPLWLDRRQDALEQIRVRQSEIERLMEGRNPERHIPEEMDRQLKSYLVQQNQWIERRKAGKLSQADAAKIASRPRAFERILELLLGVRDVNISDLQARRLEARRASQANFFLILAAGLAAAGAMTFLLSRFIIAPVALLGARARAWELGRPWEHSRPPASPEIDGLYACLGDMAGRLNARFEKEAELVRLKTQLVAVMSHEFNNALSVISGVSALLQETEGAASPEKRRQYYAMLQSNVRSLSMEASTILHMGRLESGSFALDFKRADVSLILRESVERLRVVFERKRLDVEVDVPPSPPPARGDPEALSLVVTNLFTNAIKYTPERGRITLSLGPAPGDPDRVLVAVKDTGIGIKPQDKGKIFSGYYRTQESVSAAKGFGVGLPLAAKIVEAHGSRLEVDSEPGKGSCFHFLLPAWREAA